MSVMSRIRTFLQQAKDSLVLSGFSNNDSPTGKILAGVAVLYIVIMIAPVSYTHLTLPTTPYV